MAARLDFYILMTNKLTDGHCYSCKVAIATENLGGIYIDLTHKRCFLEAYSKTECRQGSLILGQVFIGTNFNFLVPIGTLIFEKFLISQ